MRASLLHARRCRRGRGLGKRSRAKARRDLPPQLAAVLAEAEQQHAAMARRARGANGDGDGKAESLPARKSASASTRFRATSLRRTRPYHCEPTHFHYPGLASANFTTARFPWLGALEAATDAIPADFDAVMAAERAELVPYIQYPDDVPLRQWAS